MSETTIPGVVAIAASAGGLEPLVDVLAGLDAEFPLPVVAVLHIDPKGTSALEAIVGRRACLRVRTLRDGDPLEPGTVYVTPPGVDVGIDADAVVALTAAAPRTWPHPSANALFASLAACFGPQLIAVVLSGSGSDGADGAREVKSAGGTVIAQDEGAAFHGMPEAARATGVVDHVLPAAEIAAALQRVVREAARA